jgi:ATP-dependent Lon protease
MSKKVKFPIIPLRDSVVFPNTIVPLTLGRDISKVALWEAKHSYELKLILLPQKDKNKAFPSGKDFYKFGTVAEVLQIIKTPNGQIKVLVEGLSVLKITDIEYRSGYYLGEGEEINRKGKKSKEIDELLEIARKKFQEYVEINNDISRDTVNAISFLEDYNEFVDIVSSHLNVDVETKELLLSESDIKQRLLFLVNVLNSVLKNGDEKGKKKKNVVKKDEKSNSEREVGKGSKRKSFPDMEIISPFRDYDEYEEIKKKILSTRMSKEAREKALEELAKLEKTPSFSSEAAVIRIYIDWLINIPWYKKSKEIRDINRAKAILDERHYGLDDVKERILEYISVLKLTKNTKGSILCFVGPPGVGKTTLAETVAKALGRRFVKMSLGGVRDEAEIRGHRRTYVGALPGRIIQMMKRAKTINPVMLLDEIDKMSSDFRGDPAYALLEVLDPEQNKAFYDHYLEVPYDLSKVLFIATANTKSGIPYPLLDRMEIIELSGYTEREKFFIAKNHLIKKQINETGLSEESVYIPPKNLVRIIRRYTKEAGVRNLERAIAKICRKVARKIVEKGEDSNIRIVVDNKTLVDFLGPPKYIESPLHRFSSPGIANGLAWTEVGGEVLSIEVAISKGKGNLILTGKLGDVMKESAQAALSYARTNEERFGLLRNFYRKVDVHIHVPQGAIPKDGPSAGITIAVALISALSGIPARCDVAMTGEITLIGRVLPIGGLKEKILAAKRMGIKNIILPYDNQKDVLELPDNVKKGVNFHFASNMIDVLKIAIPDIYERYVFTKNQSLSKGSVQSYLDVVN